MMSFSLILPVGLLSCSGTAEEEDTAPLPEAIETETDEPSCITVGDVPGLFYYGESDGDEYARIRLLGRELRNGSQIVTFVYTGPYFSVIGTKEILKELNPRLICGEGEPSDFVKSEIVEQVGFHETVGEIFNVHYPGGSGICVLTVDTVNGPVTIGLGNADKIYRFAKKVRPGIRVNLRSGPTIKESVVRVLEPGDIVFPTGELGMLEIVALDDGSYLPHFHELNTLSGETGWAINDDEVFEYAGYLEAGGE
jgi:hypothetical protein